MHSRCPCVLSAPLPVLNKSRKWVSDHFNQNVFPNFRFGEFSLPMKSPKSEVRIIGFPWSPSKMDSLAFRAPYSHIKNDIQLTSVCFIWKLHVSSLRRARFRPWGTLVESVNKFLETKVQLQNPAKSWFPFFSRYWYFCCNILLHGAQRVRKSI